MGFWFLSLWVFVLGTIVGSFLNCLVYRLEQNKNFTQGRSFCPRCQHTLAWFDLVPVLSFFWLKGHCRYCREKISLQYPIVEITTGLLFLLIFNFQQFGPELTAEGFSIFNEFSILQFSNIARLLFFWFISACLIAIFIYDLKYYLIPDQILYPALAVAFIYLLFGNWKLEIGNWAPLLRPLFASLLASGFFFLIWFVSKGGWMGFGDVKLALLMGLFLGWPSIIVALFSAFLTGAVAGIILLILGRKKMKSEVPFGPFLVLGTFISLFCGPEMIHWYLGLVTS